MYEHACLYVCDRDNKNIPADHSVHITLMPTSRLTLASAGILNACSSDTEGLALDTGMRSKQAKVLRSLPM